MNSKVFSHASDPFSPWCMFERHNRVWAEFGGMRQDRAQNDAGWDWAEEAISSPAIWKGRIRRLTENKIAGLDSGVQRAGNLIFGSEMEKRYKRAVSVVRKEEKTTASPWRHGQNGRSRLCIDLSENDMDTLLS